MRVNKCAAEKCTRYLTRRNKYKRNKEATMIKTIESD